MQKFLTPKIWIIFIYIKNWKKSDMTHMTAATNSQLMKSQVMILSYVNSTID